MLSQIWIKAKSRISVNKSKVSDSFSEGLKDWFKLCFCFYLISFKLDCKLTTWLKYHLQWRCRLHDSEGNTALCNWAVIHAINPSTVDKAQESINLCIFSSSSQWGTVCDPHSAPWSPRGTCLLLSGRFLWASACIHLVSVSVPNT